MKIDFLVKVSLRLIVSMLIGCVLVGNSYGQNRWSNVLIPEVSPDPDLFNDSIVPINAVVNIDNSVTISGILSFDILPDPNQPRLPNQLVLVRINENGTVRWAQRLANNNVHNCKIVYEPNGSYTSACSGSLQLPPRTNFLQFVRFDSDGNVVQSKSYTENGKNPGFSYYMRDFKKMTDGSYIIALEYVTQADQKTASNLIKISNQGEILWQKLFDDDDNNSIHSMVIDPNNAVVAVGSRTVVNNSSFWIVKLNSGGETVFQKLYVGEDTNTGIQNFYLIQTSSGNFACAYNVNSNDFTGTIFVTFDSAGNKIFSKRLNAYASRALIETLDGKFLITGDAAFQQGMAELVVIDAEANFVSFYKSKSISTLGFRVAQVTKDSRYFIAGTQGTVGAGSRLKTWIVKNDLGKEIEGSCDFNSDFFGIQESNVSVFNTNLQPVSVNFESMDINLTTSSFPVTSEPSCLLPPKLSSDPNSLDFGMIQTGTRCEQRISIMNSGEAALNISGVSDPGSPFRVAFEDCNEKSLLANQSCGLDIEFNPQDTSSSTAEINILSNDPVSPNFSIMLSGSGSNSSLPCQALPTRTSTPQSTATPTMVPSTLSSSIQGGLLAHQVPIFIMIAVAGIVHTSSKRRRSQKT